VSISTAFACKRHASVGLVPAVQQLSSYTQLSFINYYGPRWFARSLIQSARRKYGSIHHVKMPSFGHPAQRKSSLQIATIGGA
jgi:hypothetical protein